MPAEFVDNSPDSINRYFPQGNRGKPLQPWGHALMKLSCSVKRAVSESLPYGGSHGGKNRPRHRKGTRAFSRLTEINPYSAPVIRGHMCLVCCTRPIASIAYFTTGNLGTFRMSARKRKKVVGR